MAFTYLGDIWIAIENGSGVMRLTDHVARGTYPRFPSDGARLAFTRHPAVWSRKPYRGAFNADLWIMGPMMVLQNHGVQPDVYADNGPGDYLAGRDRQIEKAIEVLRAEAK